MSKKTPAFSIVIPTYSGVETIAQTIDSILQQEVTHNTFEVIVIIDGPNERLLNICLESKKRFELADIPMQIKQFAKNRGRFMARIEGAKLATTSQILFLDDRTELEKGYVSNLLELKPQVAMPNVLEVEESVRSISLVLRLVRKRIYGNTWGENFKDYYVDQSNFEKSPKGTAALWISKQLFLEACKKVADTQVSSKYTSDDTRVLKEVVNKGVRILRSSRLIIYYHPRSNFNHEVKHLYGRGPLFVDYYLRPGTRFFIPLVTTYISLVILAVLAILYPLLFLLGCAIYACLTFIFAAYLARGLRQTFLAFGGLLLITLLFGAGIIKGAWLASRNRFSRSRLKPGTNE